MIGTRKFKVGDRVIEKDFDPALDQPYTVKELCQDLSDGFLVKLADHPYNGASMYDASGDWVFEENALELAPPDMFYDADEEVWVIPPEPNA